MEEEGEPVEEAEASEEKSSSLLAVDVPKQSDDIRVADMDMSDDGEGRDV